MTARAEAEPRPSVLVLGGNGFIGATFVEELLASAARPLVHVLNRGNEYWDSAVRLQGATQIACDRAEISACAGLRSSYDYAVDFSAHHPLLVTSALALLAGRVGLYLLVSSAAVYVPSAPVMFWPLREEDALLKPHSSWIRQRRRELLEGIDGYARRKLLIEEAAFAFSDRVNVTALRLPYVMGERDSTHRLALYHLWLRIRKPTLAWLAPDQPFSFIGVRGASSALRFLAHEAPRASVAGRAFNAALEPVTLRHILGVVGEAVGKEAAVGGFQHAPVGSPMAYVYDAVRYASIFRFVLDDSRLRGLGWHLPESEQNATQALRRAAAFVEQELIQTWDCHFPDEQRELALLFLESVAPEELPAARELLGRALGMHPGELADYPENGGHTYLERISWLVLSSRTALVFTISGLLQLPGIFCCCLSVLTRPAKPRPVNWCNEWLGFIASLIGLWSAAEFARYAINPGFDTEGEL